MFLAAIGEKPAPPRAARMPEKRAASELPDREVRLEPLRGLMPVAQRRLAAVAASAI